MAMQNRSPAPLQKKSAQRGGMSFTVLAVLPHHRQLVVEVEAGACRDRTPALTRRRFDLIYRVKAVHGLYAKIAHTQLLRNDWHVSPSQPHEPSGFELRRLREANGLSQTKAAELVYSTLRTWQNWESDQVGMHPAIYAWFRHRIETGEEGPSAAKARPTRYVRRVISFWWNDKDKAIHVTTQGTEQRLHTTFPANRQSERWHRSMYDWLRGTLAAADKPVPPGDLPA